MAYISLQDSADEPERSSYGAEVSKESPAVGSSSTVSKTHGMLRENQEKTLRLLRLRTTIQSVYAEDYPA